MIKSITSEPQNDLNTIQRICKQLGDGGWELITVTDNANPNSKTKGKLWVFKKPIEEK